MAQENGNKECQFGGIESWEDHLKEFRTWTETTRSIHELTSSIHQDTKYLVTLKEIANELREMRASLITAIVNRNFVPLAPALAVLSFMLMALVFIGAMTLVHYVPNNGSLEIPNTLRIEGGK